MRRKKESKKIREIKAALKLFPKIVKQKERAHREREKILRRFQKLSKELEKLTNEVAMRAENHKQAKESRNR